MPPDSPRSLRLWRLLLSPAVLLTTHMTSISGSQTWGLWFILSINSEILTSEYLAVSSKFENYFNYFSEFHKK